jgi:hypothetical protein
VAERGVKRGALFLESSLQCTGAEGQRAGHGVHGSVLCGQQLPAASGGVSVVTIEPARKKGSNLVFIGVPYLLFIALVAFIVLRYGDALSGILNTPRDYVFAGFMILTGSATVVALAMGLYWGVFLLVAFLWEVLLDIVRNGGSSTQRQHCAHGGST